MGCKRCSSSKELRGLSARAQVRRISISLSSSLGVYANVLLSKLGGATGLHLSPIHGVPLAKLLSHTAPVLVVPFLASFKALRGRKDSSCALRGDTKGQAAPEGARVLCRALRPTTEIPHVAASGYYLVQGNSHNGE